MARISVCLLALFSVFAAVGAAGAEYFSRAVVRKASC